MTARRTHMARAGAPALKICGNLRNLRMQSPFLGSLVQYSQLRSSLQAFGNRGLNFFPGNHVLGTRFMIREPAVELGTLSISQRHGGAVFSDAVPEFLDERQALLDAEPIDAKRFKRNVHTVFLPQFVHP